MTDRIYFVNSGRSDGPDRRSLQHCRCSPDSDSRYVTEIQISQDLPRIPRTEDANFGVYLIRFH